MLAKRASRQRHRLRWGVGRPPTGSAPRRVLRRAGIEVGRPGRRWVPWNVRRSWLPEDAPNTGDCLWISLDRFTTFAGFSYRPNGWHPYRATVEWLLSHDAPTYAESPLSDFYARFQPRTLADVYFDADAAAPPLDRLPAWLVAQIWTLDHRTLSRFPAPSQPGLVPNSEHVGPLGESYGEHKLAKLSRLIKSIGSTGYRPLEHEDGVVEGLFLHGKDGQYVFVPTEGQHRLGVLSAMGVGEVLVRPRPSGPTVDERRLGEWARAWGLDPSSPLPHRVLDFYFQSDGREQAERWGLGPR